MEVTRVRAKEQQREPFPTPGRRRQANLGFDVLALQRSLAQDIESNHVAHNQRALQPLIQRQQVHHAETGEVAIPGIENDCTAHRLKAVLLDAIGGGVVLANAVAQQPQPLIAVQGIIHYDHINHIDPG